MLLLAANHAEGSFDNGCSVTLPYPTSAMRNAAFRGRDYLTYRMQCLPDIEGSARVAVDYSTPKMMQYVTQSRKVISTSGIFVGRLRDVAA